MNEFELIKKITHGAPIGDDCFVFGGPDGKDYIVTTDALFEGVHFRRDWISPQTLGRKALSVNVSDVAAMGGKPLFYLVSVGIPKGASSKEIESVFEGMALVAASHRMTLAGGDTCASERGLLLSLTAVGSVEKGRAVLRSAAAAGDSVYVTGELGGAALGLACLEAGLADIEARVFIRRHNDPVPRVACGQWLAASTCLSSMIDVSDGLVQDLGHIAESSGVGLKIYADKIPMARDFAGFCARCRKDPLKLALTGGEDYELAFTVSRAKSELFEKMLGVVLPTFGHAVTRIGEVTDGRGVQIIDVHGRDMAVEQGGFEHKF